MLTLNSEAGRTRQDPHQVFVYGTLKKGFGNHDRHLKNARFLGQAQIDGIMFHLGGFPAINLGDKYTKILGEVYQATWDDILAMDVLEGHPDFYQRVEIEVYPYKKAWTYILPHDRAEKEKYIIPSGCWRGPESTKVAWAGWGKGALVGAFQTDREKSSILLGYSENKPNFELRKNLAKDNYELVQISTREVLGIYKNLGDLIRHRTQNKSTLSLSPRTTTQAAEEVKKQIYRNAAGIPNNYNPPPRQTIVDVPVVVENPPPKKVIELQVARLMDLNVREA